MHLMETRARKEDHLLEISHRLCLEHRDPKSTCLLQKGHPKASIQSSSCPPMLWFAKLRLELNGLFLTLPLLDTLSPSLLFSSTYCIFLFPLQTIHTCPVSLLLPRCLFLERNTSSPALSPEHGSGIQEENELDAARGHCTSAILTSPSCREAKEMVQTVEQPRESLRFIWGLHASQQ